MDQSKKNKNEEEIQLGKGKFLLLKMCVYETIYLKRKDLIKTYVTFYTSNIWMIIGACQEIEQKATPKNYLEKMQMKTNAIQFYRYNTEQNHNSWKKIKIINIFYIQILNNILSICFIDGRMTYHQIMNSEKGHSWINSPSYPVFDWYWIWWDILKY